MRRPISIDLFAGAGGMSLGFEQAGFDVVAAAEIDPIHAAVHSFNFPDSAVLARSVVGLTGRDIRHAANIGRQTVDVVFGGPPCQGFSMIGQRVIDDPRNLLVREFVRIVHELDANYFVFENVKGITVGKQSAILQDLISEFDGVGYNIITPWKVLNASNFGVPQNRERLFLIGSKKGLASPSYPMPVTRAAGSRNTESNLPFGPSCEEAIGDIPDAELFPELNEHDSVSVQLGPASPYSSVLRGLARDPNDFSYRRIWDASNLTSSLRTGHSVESRERFSKNPEGSVEQISRFFKLPRQGVSNTLRAGTDSARGAFTSPRPIHYQSARCITVREMMRLHGYPDWFRMHSTKWHGARQVGNSVPPPLARAVASEILFAAGLKGVAPTDSIALGDENLLRLDMRQASEYFKVDVPIKTRSRVQQPSEANVINTET